MSDGVVGPVTVGDVLELQLPPGDLAYLQVAKDGRAGAMFIRVLPGIYTESLREPELSDLASGPTRITLHMAVLEDEPRIRVVGHHPVPAADRDGVPLVHERHQRAGEQLDWWLQLPGGALVEKHEFLREYPDRDLEEVDLWPRWGGYEVWAAQELIGEGITHREQQERLHAEWAAHDNPPPPPPGVEALFSCRFETELGQAQRCYAALEEAGFSRHILEVYGLGDPADHWWLLVRTGGRPGEEDMVRLAAEAEGGCVAGRGADAQERAWQLVERMWALEED